MDKKALKIAYAAIAISIVTSLFLGIDVYLTHFYSAGADLRIEHLDGEYANSHNSELKFSFDLYNNGDEPAFINSISLTQVLGSGKETAYSPLQIFEYDNDIVDSKSSLGVNLTLNSPGIKASYDLKIYVNYDPGSQFVSKSFIVRWT